MGVAEFAEVQRLILHARREILTMVVASFRGEEGERALFAAARASLALDAAAHLIRRMSIHEGDLGVVAGTLHTTKRWVMEHLSRNLDSTGTTIVQTVRAWMQRRLANSELSQVYSLLASAASSTSVGAFDGERVVFRHVDVSELDLQYATFLGSTLEASTFDHAALTHAIFDDAFVVGCTFDRCGLSSATLRRTHFARCRLAATALDDTTLDHAIFVDSDLRGANLSAPKLGIEATASEIEFVRCDLRVTNWRGRFLKGARFVDCKMGGTFGRPVFEGLEIEGADLSVAGDGSRVAKGSEVVAEWRL